MTHKRRNAICLECGQTFHHHGEDDGDDHVCLEQDDNNELVLNGSCLSAATPFHPRRRSALHTRFLPLTPRARAPPCPRTCVAAQLLRAARAAARLAARARGIRHLERVLVLRRRAHRRFVPR